jgi:RHS repeat-associated protein
VGFTGQRFEAPVGLYDYGARWYHPELGRFLTPDSFVPDALDSQSLNRYAYVRNNPINRIDPDGNQDFSIGFTYEMPDELWWDDPNGTNRFIFTGLLPAVTVGPLVSLLPPAWAGTLGGAATAYGFGSLYHVSDDQAAEPIIGPLWNEWGMTREGAGLMLGAVGGLSAYGSTRLSAVPQSTAAEQSLLQRTLSGTGRAGWRVGDDIYTPTASGKAPAWSTVQGRYWKNEAAKSGAAARWGDSNAARMARGRAPQRYNADKGGMESMELSHEPIPRRDGGLQFVPRWPQDHAAVDPYRRPGY